MMEIFLLFHLSVFSNYFCNEEKLFLKYLCADEIHKNMKESHSEN